MDTFKETNETIILQNIAMAFWDSKFSFLNQKYPGRGNSHHPDMN